MGLYFFDTDDGERRLFDADGIDLPDEVEAVEQALSLLRDLSHGPAQVGEARTLSVRVRAAGGEDLYAVALRLTIERLGATPEADRDQVGSPDRAKMLVRTTI